MDIGLYPLGLWEEEVRRKGGGVEEEGGRGVLITLKDNK